MPQADSSTSLWQAGCLGRLQGGLVHARFGAFGGALARSAVDDGIDAGAFEFAAHLAAAVAALGARENGVFADSLAAVAKHVAGEAFRADKGGAGAGFLARAHQLAVEASWANDGCFIAVVVFFAVDDTGAARFAAAGADACIAGAAAGGVQGGAGCGRTASSAAGPASSTAGPASSAAGSASSAAGVAATGAAATGAACRSAGACAVGGTERVKVQGTAGQRDGRKSKDRTHVH